MPLKIGVLAKQVIDPEMPMAAFRVDSDSKKVVTPPNIPPVVNGFDENAVEAALQIKDSQEATITVISCGTAFALDVMKKPLSMGADELVLLQSPLNPPSPAPMISSNPDRTISRKKVFTLFIL